MTDGTGTPAPGWYDDPAGTARLRWWDGTQWTENFHEPVQYGEPAAPGYVPPAGHDSSGAAGFAAHGFGAAGSGAAGSGAARFGAVAQPRLPAEARVTNVYIWLVVLLPILSLVAIATMDMRSYVTQLLSGAPGGADQAWFPATAVSWAVTIATIVLAYFDWRELKKAGLVRPFHWAWMFLAGAVYVIGRTVVVRKHSGRGLLPLWLWIAVTVIYAIVILVKMEELMAVVTTIPAVPAGA